jgi:hypothetical protein
MRYVGTRQVPKTEVGGASAAGASAANASGSSLFKPPPGVKLSVSAAKRSALDCVRCDSLVRLESSLAFSCGALSCQASQHHEAPRLHLLGRVFRSRPQPLHLICAPRQPCLTPCACGATRRSTIRLQGVLGPKAGKADGGDVVVLQPGQGLRELKTAIRKIFGKVRAVCWSGSRSDVPAVGARLGNDGRAATAILHTHTHTHTYTRCWRAGETARVHTSCCVFS